MIDPIDYPFARVKIPTSGKDPLYASSKDALLSMHFDEFRAVEDADQASIYTRYRAGLLVVALTTLRAVEDAIIEPVSFSEWLESTR